MTAFDSAGWSLAPGDIAGLIETPFGYHIIRRPPLNEVRSQLLTYLQERAGVGLDSMYLDSLSIARKLDVSGQAPKLMRAAFLDRNRSFRSTERVASYEGGELTVADYMPHAPDCPARCTCDAMQQANDSALTQFAKVIGQNTLLLRQADSAGIHLSAEEWSGVMQKYQAQIDSLKAGLDLAGPDITDSTIPLPERQKMAQLRLDAVWNKIASGATRPRPLPPALSASLREHASFRINDAALQEALSRPGISRRRKRFRHWREEEPPTLQPQFRFLQIARPGKHLEYSPVVEGPLSVRARVSAGAGPVSAQDSVSTRDSLIGQDTLLRRDSVRRRTA